MKGLKRYIADPTRRTPRIVLETGRIFIVGRSIPENPGEFYRPVYEWISQYVQINGHQDTVSSWDLNISTPVPPSGFTISSRRYQK